MCFDRIKRKYGFTTGDILAIAWLCFLPCVTIFVGFYFVAFPDSFLTALQDDDGNLSIDIIADKLTVCMGCMSVIIGIIIYLILIDGIKAGVRKHLNKTATFDDVDALKERIDSLEYEVKLLRTAMLCNDETLADGEKR